MQGSLYLWLSNHKVEESLKVRVQTCACYFYGMPFAEGDLFATSGFIEVQLPGWLKYAHATGSQPYGQICFAAHYAQELSTSSTCPTVAERQQPIPIISETIDLTKECTISAMLCNLNEGQCPTSPSSAETSVAVEVQDGSIEVTFAINSTFLLDYESVNYRRIKPVFSVDSYMNIYALNETLTSNEGKDYTYIFELAGPAYAGIWTYITRRSYLEARVWPLSAVSLGLLKPELKRT